MKMEENHRTESPLRSSNLTSAGSFTGELTELNSDASFSTAEGSLQFLRDAANAGPDEGPAWTNEKHNLYLDHLETTFVRQLQQSMDLHSLYSDHNKNERNLSQKLPSNIPKVSGQVIMVQEGYCQKIKSEKDETLLYTAADSHDVFRSLWAQHVRYFCTGCLKVPVKLQECCGPHSVEKQFKGKRKVSSSAETRSEELHFSHLYLDNSDGCMAEGSGQNFVDENSNEHLDNSPPAKKLNTGAVDHASEDQIMPCVKFHFMEDSAGCSSTSILQGNARCLPSI